MHEPFNKRRAILSTRTLDKLYDKSQFVFVKTCRKFAFFETRPEILHKFLLYFPSFSNISIALYNSELNVKCS